MKLIRYGSRRFRADLKSLQRRAVASPEVEETVRGIVADVRDRGDAAVLEYTKKFGGPKLIAAGMRVAAAEFRESETGTDRDAQAALRLAYENVRAFALRGLRKSWQMRNAQGVRVGESFQPFERVGIYVPGGSAPLVSTAIMTVTLAAAAGVPEIVVATPSDAAGCVHAPLLFALQLAGATEVFRIGGAQAIAALAHGTKTIRPTAKVFGPGNAYVVEAKRQLFGLVAVDLLPGPSEILVIADDTAEPSWIAADLLAQAEHGHGSVGFITDAKRLIELVSADLREQAGKAGRPQEIVRVMLDSLFMVLVETLWDAVEIANDFAPEHVSIVAETEEALAGRIRTARAIFLGRWSPVAGGDFVAGPSHELPTGGSGKSFSGLTVDQFQRCTSIVRFDEKSLRKSLAAIEAISALEKLDRHAASAAIRVARRLPGNFTQ